MVQTRRKYEETARLLWGRIRTLEAALAPLAQIADQYDEEGLNEDRPSWREKRIDVKPFSQVGLISGRGGSTLLTLQHAFDAREARKKTVSSFRYVGKPNVST